MRVLVVGATGRMGRDLVDEALAEGMTVRAFARSAADVDWPTGVEVMAGSVLEAADVDRAVQGVDAVIVAISMVRTSNNPWARILTPTDLHVRAADLLTRACVRHGVPRYLAVSAHGVGDSAPRAGTLFLALVRSSNIGVAYQDLARAESVVRATPLTWTLVRPTRLTEAPGTGRWRVDPDLVTTSLDRIPRRDVARFLVTEAQATRHPRQTVSLTG